MQLITCFWLPSLYVYRAQRKEEEQNPKQSLYTLNEIIMVLQRGGLRLDTRYSTIFGGFTAWRLQIGYKVWHNIWRFYSVAASDWIQGITRYLVVLYVSTTKWRRTFFTQNRTMQVIPWSDIPVSVVDPGFSVGGVDLLGGGHRPPT